MSLSHPCIYPITMCCKLYDVEGWSFFRNPRKKRNIVRFDPLRRKTHTGKKYKDTKYLRKHFILHKLYR